MDVVLAVQARARQDVAALGPRSVPPTRAARDIRLAALMPRGKRRVKREMRAAGLLRPWWDRAPLLMLVAPLVLAYGLVFREGGAIFLGLLVALCGAAWEPRMNRSERRECAFLVIEYRNAAADALDARGDGLAYGWGDAPGWVPGT